MTDRANNPFDYAPEEFTAEDYEPEDYAAEDYEDFDGEFFDDAAFEDDDDDDDDESFDDVEAFDDEDYDDDDDESMDDDDDDMESFMDMSEDDDDDDDDEAFESYGEMDEDDDDDDESIDSEEYGEGSEITLRAMRARARRRRTIARLKAQRRASARRRKAAAQQRAARARASRLRRSLNRKLAGIRTRRVRTRKLPKFKGKNVITARLPSGAVTKMILSPQLATHRSVTMLTRRLSADAAKHAKALRLQNVAISKLKSAQKTAIKSVTAQQTRLSKRITAGDAKLDKRISNEITSHKKRYGRLRNQMTKSMRKERTRSMLNTAMIGSSLPFFAAYGERSNPLAKNNVILTGALAAGLFGDELIDKFLTQDGKSKGWSRTAQLWAWAAPVLVNAGVHFYFRNQQHERFVTDVTTVSGYVANNTIEIDLQDKVASDSFDDFKKLSNVAAVASIVDTGGTTATGLTARVNDGKLIVDLNGDSLADGAPVIAWAVDTLDKAA